MAEGLPPAKATLWKAHLHATWSRLEELDQSLHSWISGRFPRPVALIDKTLVALVDDILSHNLFALLVTFILVALSMAGVNWLLLVSILGAWLVSFLWIARSGPVRKLTVLSRLVVLIIVGCATGVAGMQFGRWALDAYKRNQNHPTPTIAYQPLETAISVQCHSSTLPIFIPPRDRTKILLLHRNPEIVNPFNDADSIYHWPDAQDTKLPPKGEMPEIIQKCDVVSGNQVVQEVSIYLAASSGNSSPVNTRMYFPLLNQSPITFYVVNQCASGANVQIPDTVTVQLLNESNLRKVPLLGAPQNSAAKFLLFFPSNAKWPGPPTCS